MKKNLLLQQKKAKTSLSKKTSIPLPKEPTAIGKVGAAYGISGWLHISSFTKPIKNILNYSEFYIHHAKKIQKIHLERGQEYRPQKLIIKIAEINTREEAQQYTNQLMLIERQSLPSLPKGEYYWQDLINTQVITKTGILLGKVETLLSTGSNDVLIVTGDRERLIPYTHDTIVKINIRKQEIIVDWDPTF